MLNSCCASVESLTKEKGLQIVREFEEVTWSFDKDRISQVVVNILANAVKFSPLKETILIRSMHSDDVLTIEICDRGPGVPAEMMESIFEKYKQNEATRAQEKSGTGLGLAICKTIVEQHGGSLGVRQADNNGQGSIFWFTLPCCN